LQWLKGEDSPVAHKIVNVSESPFTFSKILIKERKKKERKKGGKEKGSFPFFI